MSNKYILNINTSHSRVSLTCLKGQRISNKPFNEPITASDLKEPEKPGGFCCEPFSIVPLISHVSMGNYFHLVFASADLLCI